ncbi:MAG: hypothetical protein ACR2QC_05740 [Gammaproteobacteria bacterium]
MQFFGEKNAISVEKYKFYSTPSHSCESRNLRAMGANCKRRTITRRFAAAEIPAFAGMGRVVGMKLKGSGGKFCAYGAEIPAFAGMVYFN